MQGGLLTWKLEKPFVLWEGSGVVTVFQSTQALRWLLGWSFWGEACIGLHSGLENLLVDNTLMCLLRARQHDGFGLGLSCLLFRFSSLE